MNIDPPVVEAAVPAAYPNTNREALNKGLKGRRLTQPPLPHQGFTLVEMLLVLVILATLAAIVIPKFSGRSEQAKITAAKAQIKSIELALDSFEVDCGYYPKTGNLNALLENPSSSADWKGPYLKQGIPNDPWGNAYTYEYPGKHNANGYDLMSSGPDGKSGDEDDITNWDANSK